MSSGRLMVIVSLMEGLLASSRRADRGSCSISPTQLDRVDRVEGAAEAGRAHREGQAGQQRRQDDRIAGETQRLRVPLPAESLCRVETDEGPAVGSLREQDPRDPVQDVMDLDRE